MKKLSRLVISLPLLVLPFALQAQKPALASELSAVQALQILAMAQAADDRCNALSASEHGELASYRNRAEMASISMLSGAQRSKAIAQGVAQGRTTPCNDATRADIRETLRAAREAIATADGQPAPQKPEPAAKPKPAKPAASLMKPAGTSGPVTLPVYSGLLKPYYADLRCHTLSRSAATRYWRAIIRLQRGMVAKYGTPTVASAQASARRSASGMSCSSTASAAARGLSDISSR